MRTCKNCNNYFYCSVYACSFDDGGPSEKEIDSFCKAMGGWKPYERKHKSPVYYGNKPKEDNNE